MPSFRLSVSALKARIRTDNFGRPDPVDLAREELSSVLTLLNFKKLSYGDLEFSQKLRVPIYRAIHALWPWPDMVARYRSTIVLILETIQYENIRAIEVKVDYERVKFPCDMWCRKSADATEADIADAGGLDPSFATEICYDKDQRWTPKTFFFGIQETRTVLPLEAGATSAPKSVRGAFSKFGSRTYYFLVPSGTYVYSQRGTLTGELAFSNLLSMAYIWFVQDTTGVVRAVEWKKDADRSRLPQPSETAADLIRLSTPVRTQPSLVSSSSSDG
jgi:hypothetical protein